MKMGTNDARCIVCALGISFFLLCFFFIYSLIIHFLFMFYLCFEAQVGLMAMVGGGNDKNGHKQCI
jgi:hypothetical protein